MFRKMSLDERATKTTIIPVVEIKVKQIVKKRKTSVLNE